MLACRALRIIGAVVAAVVVVGALAPLYAVLVAFANAMHSSALPLHILAGLVVVGAVLCVVGECLE